MLQHYTKIYKYLSSLHLQLIDISCKFQLFFKEFDDIEKNIPKELVYNNTTDLSNNNLLSDFLNLKKSVDKSESHRNAENSNLKSIPFDLFNSEQMKTSTVTEKINDSIRRHDDMQPSNLLNNEIISNQKFMENFSSNAILNNFSLMGSNMGYINSNNFSLNNHQVKPEDLKKVTDTLLNMIPAMNPKYNPSQSFSSENTCFEGLNSFFDKNLKPDADISDFVIKPEDDIKVNKKTDNLITFSSNSNSTVSDNSKTYDLSCVNKVGENKKFHSDESLKQTNDILTQSKLLESNEILQDDMFDNNEYLENEMLDKLTLQQKIESPSENVYISNERFRINTNSVPSGSKDNPIIAMDRKSLNKSNCDRNSSTDESIEMHRSVTLKNIIENSGMYSNITIFLMITS